MSSSDSCGGTCMMLMDAGLKTYHLNFHHVNSFRRAHNATGVGFTASRALKIEKSLKKELKYAFGVFFGRLYFNKLRFKRTLKLLSHLMCLASNHPHKCIFMNEFQNK